MKRERNDKKFIYLKTIKHHKELSSRDLALITHKLFSDKTFHRHYYNTMHCLNTYTTKFTKALLRRHKGNGKGPYIYSLTMHGRKRLKQMIAAKAFFGVYRLKYYNVQLLVKGTHGTFKVNPDIIEYAHHFCDVDPMKLWQHV